MDVTLIFNDNISRNSSSPPPPSHVGGPPSPSIFVFFLLKKKAVALLRKILKRIAFITNQGKPGIHCCFFLEWSAYRSQRRPQNPRRRSTTDRPPPPLPAFISFSSDIVLLPYIINICTYFLHQSKDNVPAPSKLPSSNNHQSTFI